MSVEKISEEKMVVLVTTYLGNSPRALTIGVYALCGFTNPGALGVQIATIGGLCPERRADVSRVIARAFLAGCLACFMTASIAGALIRD